MGLFLLSAISVISFTSCNNDNCKKQACQNGGTCNGKHCTCPDGYIGDLCEKELRTQYLGTYKGELQYDMYNYSYETKIVLSNSARGHEYMKMQIIDSLNNTLYEFDTKIKKNKDLDLVPNSAVDTSLLYTQNHGVFDDSKRLSFYFNVSKKDYSDYHQYTFRELKKQ